MYIINQQISVKNIFEKDTLEDDSNKVHTVQCSCTRKVATNINDS